MAIKCSSVPRQHFVFLVEDMPIFGTAAIATIVENVDRDASLEIIQVPGSHKTPIRTYLFTAFLWQKIYKFLYVSTKELDSTNLALSTNNGK